MAKYTMSYEERREIFGDDAMPKPRTRYFVNQRYPSDVRRVTITLFSRDRDYDARLSNGTLREITHAEYREALATYKRSVGHTWSVYLDAEQNTQLLDWAKAHGCKPQTAAAAMVTAFLQAERKRQQPE